jgi:predicted unusual protein kinase regulating ubiquinone biosynthesis (AarF/ABC1/UbiB family)
MRLHEAAQALDAPTKARLVARLVDIMLQMFIADGLFHADLHPGNIFFPQLAIHAEVEQRKRAVRMCTPGLTLGDREPVNDEAVALCRLMLHAKALTTAETIVFVLAPERRFEQLSRPFIAREYAARMTSPTLLQRRASQLLPELGDPSVQH